MARRIYYWLQRVYLYWRSREKLLMIILGLVVVVSAVVSINIQRQAAKPAPYVNPYETLVGVALSPKSYKGEKFTSFFDKAKEIGNAVSWSGPWQDFAKSNGTPSDIATLAKQKGFMPIYLTGPTIEEVKNGDYQTAMTAAIGKFAATEQPKYIGIGHEIDQLYLSSPELLKKYLKAAKPVVGRLRSTSASVKIFATIQYERSQGLRGGLFGGTNDESKSILKKVLPQLEMFDFVAFTTYPGLIYKTPEDLPDDYYSKVTSLTSKPIIFTEVGWSRSAPEEGYDGSESAQAEFIKEFRHQMEDIKPVLQLWSFLYPQKVSSVFETMSLLATDQETSPGFEAWKRK